MHTFFFLMGLIITNHNLEKDVSNVTPKLTYYIVPSEDSKFSF